MLATAKIEAKKILENLPDSTSFEEIQYHLYIAEKLSNARKQIKAGKVHTQEDVEHMFLPSHMEVDCFIQDSKKRQIMRDRYKRWNGKSD